MKVWNRILVVAAVCAVAALAAPAEPPTAVEPAPAPAVEPLAAPAATPAFPPALEPKLLDPWDDDYGTCYLDCGELEPHRIDFVTYGECCNTLYTCPGGGFPLGKWWRPYAAGGSPALCTT